MSLTLVTPPSAEPVALADAKAFLRVEHSADDALIEEFLVAARRRYDGRDGMLGRALVTQVWQMRLDTFPAGEIEVPLPPLQSIDSVSYEAEDGTTAALTEGTDFRVDSWSAPGRIVPVNGWPKTAKVPGAVTIEFTAGYGGPADVPNQLTTAILQTIGTWYDTSRSSVVVDMGRPRTVPQTGDDLARDFKVAWEF